MIFVMDGVNDIETSVAQINENCERILSKLSSREKYFIFLKDKSAVPFVYSSLSISGVEVSKNYVKTVVDNGFVDSNQDVKLGNEILEQYDAYIKIFRLVDQKEITEDDIKGLHKILFSRSEDSSMAGKYPYGKNKVIALKMKDFLQWFNSSQEVLDVVTFAAMAYQKYIYIHPFKGGNGKMARLVMNLASLRKMSTPIIIPAEEQTEYERLIKESKEIMSGFVNYIAKCAIETQGMLLKRGVDIYSPKKNRHLRNLDCSDTVLEVIKNTPGIKIMQIKEFVKQISFIKLQRTISGLRHKGLVEFRGPLRSGGYFYIENNIGLTETSEETH